MTGSRPGLLLVAAATALLLSGCTTPPIDSIAHELSSCRPFEEDADYEAASRYWIARAAGDAPWVVGYAESDRIDAMRAPGAAIGAERLPSAAMASVRARHDVARLATLGPRSELVRASGPGFDPLALLADPDVRYLHPDVPLVRQAVPDDDYLSDQWHLTDFGLPTAWTIETGSADVTIAVIDAGFDVDHPDLQDAFDPGWDFTDGDADVSTTDPHGTHVASIAGGRAGGGKIVGVAPTGVRLLPLKVADANGSIDTSSVVDAIYFAIGLDDPSVAAPPPSEPARVISISLGTDAPATEPIPAIEDAIRTARAAGSLTFAATGNTNGAASGAGISAPANGPCAIAVGSVDQSMDRSAFSNYDRNDRLVDLAAPGGYSAIDDGILSALPSNVFQTEPYGYLVGTSMATPYVAGVAALLFSHDASLSAHDVYARLLTTALRPDPDATYEIGFGVTCADAALGTDRRCGRP
ncbi:MAG: S8 family serine peptidase [Trueperaceae bacterium]|nr:S8 family serine peptidase [Trueperaceae bacterium]